MNSAGLPVIDRLASFHRSKGATEVRPFSVLFEENQVLNRQFIELGGYLPSDMWAAPNRYARYEKILDHSFWLGVAVASPIVLGYGLVRVLSKGFYKMGLPTLSPLSIPAGTPFIQKLKIQLEALGNRTPLQVPWEWLDASKTVSPHLEQLAPLSQRLGFPSPEALKGFLDRPDVLKKILSGKLWILLIDMALMASNAQIKLWGKNYLTLYLSGGKQGFSSAFNYAGVLPQFWASQK